MQSNRSFPIHLHVEESFCHQFFLSLLLLLLQTKATLLHMHSIAQLECCEHSLNLPLAPRASSDSQKPQVLASASKMQLAQCFFMNYWYLQLEIYSSAKRTGGKQGEVMWQS